MPAEKQIWDLVAYLGRYGHQPASVVLNLPVRDLRMMADSVDDLVKQETAAFSGKTRD